MDWRLLLVRLNVNPMKKSNRKIDLKKKIQWQSTDLDSVPLIFVVVKELNPLLIFIDGLVVLLKKL